MFFIHVMNEGHSGSRDFRVAASFLLGRTESERTTLPTDGHRTYVRSLQF
jgi:hypothetical protein